MKLAMYFLPFILLHGFLIGITAQENSAILDGFKQFIGEIYHYECKQLIGGLSKNAQYLYSVNDNKYVVRILGESFLKRYNEINIHSLAANNGIAPKIYYNDNEYSFIIMDFIEGHTLCLEQAIEREVLDLIVQKIHLTTQLDVNRFINKDKWDLFTQINNDYNKIKNQADVIFNSMIEKTFNEVNILHQSLKKEQIPLVFCHNDLNSRNIFFTEKNIVLIDWEMAGMNYKFYDLAYYSVFHCLHESDDYYLLTKYLQQDPSAFDLHYFKRIKLMIRCCNAFYLLAFLESIPTSIPMESIKDLDFYVRTFARDATVVSPEFLYKLAISQLQTFYEEYKNLKI